jgi:hypothetical protein
MQSLDANRAEGGKGRVTIWSHGDGVLPALSLQAGLEESLLLSLSKEEFGS